VSDGDDLVKADLEGPPQILLAMRRVANNIQAPRGSEHIDQWVRAIKEKDPDKFLGRLIAAEREYRAGAVKRPEQEEGSGAATAAPDPGTDRALELIERLLGEANR
jgi:hypothetical protein